MPNTECGVPMAASTPLRVGASGPQVSNLQRRLNAEGEKLPVTGTQEAMRRHQLVQKIVPANRVVGPSTASSLTRDSFQAAPARRAVVSLTVPVAPRSGFVQQTS